MFLSISFCYLSTFQIVIPEPLSYQAHYSAMHSTPTSEQPIEFDLDMATGHWPQDNPGGQSTLHHAAWHPGSPP